jgi:hypothetical protein
VEALAGRKHCFIVSRETILAFHSTRATEAFVKNRSRQTTTENCMSKENVFTMCVTTHHAHAEHVCNGKTLLTPSLLT